MKASKAKQKPQKQERFSGILVHPTSFPGPYGIGDLGKEAYQFIDFLKDSGQSLWQCLPLGPTGFGDSPYQAFSSFAGQPLIISPDKLADMNLLTEEDLTDIPEWDETKIDYGPVIQYKTSLLKTAYEHFKENTDESLAKAYTSFCRKHKKWLDEYALFMALKDENGGVSWHEWPDEYKYADLKARRKYARKFKDETGYYKFIQFIFYKQWHELKDYAHQNGIRIIGDIPIFVAPDSADVWANKELFQLDKKGYPKVVAGVPPDYFSATGQLWGNPLYDWEQHKATGYSWWISRIKSQLELVDFLRIDHFRGFESYWAIPYGQKTAQKGKWRKGPGADFFEALYQALGNELPIIAEDLGIITPEVEELRDQFHLPGMKVLQFAFDNVEENNFLPHTYQSNCICYTGTHDNDTTIGWYKSTSDASRDKVRRYMNCDGSMVAHDFIRTAMGSVARCAIFPLQDALSLDTDARMNTPGTRENNWAWRYTSDLLTPGLTRDLKELTILYGRRRTE